MLIIDTVYKMRLECLVILDNKEAIKGTRITSKGLGSQLEDEIISAAMKVIHKTSKKKSSYSAKILITF